MTTETPKAYTRNSYEGKPHFSCNSCRYDSFDEARMKAHVTKHPAPAPSAASAAKTETKAADAGSGPAASKATPLSPATEPKGEPKSERAGGSRRE